MFIQAKSAVESRPRSASKRRGKELEGWLLLAPLALVALIVMIVPSSATVYFSFTDWSGLGDSQWIGLQNYQQLLVDDAFIQAFTNNLKWLGLAITVPPLIGLVTASILAQTRFARTFLRAAVFVPMLLSSVVTAGIWRGLLDGEVGLGGWLSEVGVPGLDIFWLGNPTTALWAVAFVAAWQSSGFFTVLYLTAIQGIDSQLYDAASVDGANGLRKFIHITLPGIRPTFVVSLLFAFMGAILVFDYVYLLTQGGPGGSSQVLGTLAYKEAFTLFEAGYGSAIGVTMSIVVGLGALVYLLVRRLGWERAD